MPRLYADKAEALTPAALPDETLTEIGRLVRAFADIEELVTLYICNLAEISQSRALVLLGKTALVRRLEIAEYLAYMTGKEIAALHKQIFSSGFRESLECRNAVAHGIVLGKTNDGRFAFLTSKTELPTGTSAIQLAITYHHESIAEFAKVAEAAIPLLEKHLKLGELRAQRYQGSLLPHRKAKPGTEKSGRRKR
jgi:hypothetical protein